MIDIDADTAVTLAPHLKQAQLDMMANGDDFLPILPNFEVYRMRITHGHEPSQVTTDAIGVKGSPKDAKLLGKFFTQMAADTSTDPRNGVFLPKGAVHLIGPSTFEQVLKENNFFLTTVATVPVNLQYEAWFAVIDANQMSDTEPISIHDHLLRQPWFIQLESVTRNKTLLVTTKSNLTAAREWLDANLEPMIRKSIPSDIEPPPSHVLPHRLDKPVYTETSRTYAEILKQQFSFNTTETTTNTNTNWPPHKCQATVIDYDSDMTESPTITAVVAPITNNNNSTPSSNNTNLPSMATQIDYANELLSLKSKIQAL